MLSALRIIAFTCLQCNVCYRKHMSKAKTNKRTFRIQDGNFADAYAFVEEQLTRKDLSKEAALETLLVFEALMQKLIDWGLDENTDVEIQGEHRLGDFRIKVGFEGRVFAPGDEDEGSIEDKILEGHDDKIDYSYFSGYNTISISVSRSYRSAMVACGIAALCAVIAYFPISFMLDTSAQQDLLANYVFPLEEMYTNAMLMVGAPMTFFSLLKNLTNTYVVAQRSSTVRRLQARTIATSAFAVVLAFVAFSLLSVAISSWEGLMSAFSGSFNQSLNSVANTIIPSSIFKPFEVISPIPLMIVAFLSTYALCSAGKYFDELRRAMMACYTVFSRMLHVVIAVLPVFCFVSIMDVLLDMNFGGLYELLVFFAIIYGGLAVLLVSYAVRLRLHGIKVIPFVKNLIPLLRENINIGSAINATPYNIRYCSRVFKMNRSMLERNVPVLAEINLDGNCFILMIFTLMFIFLTGTAVSWLDLVGLGLLVLFLSFGAPNQPGSILIGTLIILMYLNSTLLLCTAIYTEAFAGGAQNLINVIGDMVMVAIEDSKEKKAAAENA